MKLSDLRPCDNCGGKIAPTWYVVRYSIAMINHRAINEQMGLMQFFGGGGSGMALAGAMGAEGENVANIAMDDPKCKDLMVEVWLCNDCYSRDVNLAMLAEKKAEEEKP